ncbi:MAG TPA: RNA methyltransferase, partial [Thermoanaerobaculia bacterium]|nr:RNA methyltransferase [Thermoanaerobaculia bacterium]
MLVYGFHPVREALRHRPHEVTRLWVAKGRGGGRRREIEQLAGRHRVEVTALPSGELGQLTGQDEAVHNGFAAELSAAAEVATAARDDDLVVLVEDVQDPRNLGALMRVCEGAGVGRLLIRDRGSAPVSPVAVKASAGAAEWLPSERITNSANSIEALKRDGYWVYGVAPGGEPAWEIDLTGKVVLAFGGEEKGLRQRTETLCDRLIGLPMRGRVESLNLSTAAAAVLY